MNKFQLLTACLAVALHMVSVFKYSNRLSTNTVVYRPYENHNPNSVRWVPVPIGGEGTDPLCKVGGGGATVYFAQNSKFPKNEIQGGGGVSGMRSRVLWVHICLFSCRLWGKIGGNSRLQPPTLRLAPLLCKNPGPSTDFGTMQEKGGKGPISSPMITIQFTSQLKNPNHHNIYGEKHLVKKRKCSAKSAPGTQRGNKQSIPATLDKREM